MHYGSNVDNVLEHDVVVEIFGRIVGEIEAIVAHDEQAELVLAEQASTLVVLHARLLLVEVHHCRRQRRCQIHIIVVKRISDHE